MDEQTIYLIVSSINVIAITAAIWITYTRALKTIKNIRE